MSPYYCQAFLIIPKDVLRLNESGVSEQETAKFDAQIAHVKITCLDEFGKGQFPEHGTVWPKLVKHSFVIEVFEQYLDGLDVVHAEVGIGVVIGRFRDAVDDSQESGLNSR